MKTSAQKTLKTILAAFAFAAIIFNVSDAEATTFTSTGDGGWSTASTWTKTLITPGSVNDIPGPGDIVYIIDEHDITVSEDIFCETLYITAATRANTHTGLDLDGKTLTVGRIEITGGPNDQGNSSKIAELDFSGGTVFVNGPKITNVLLANVNSLYNVDGSGTENYKTNPLPVELTSFKAVKKTNEVALSWETASEKNNTGFEVQSSTDGRNYEAVGFVATQNGNASSVQRYAFTHKTGSKEGLVYYRLKQIDLDGTFEYYTAKVVDLGRFTSSVVTYPNPFQDQFRLELEATTQETVEIMVTDMAGKTVYATTADLQKGLNSLNVALGQQPAGLYLLKATAGSKTYVNRLVKQ